jgi:hypothetical protein
MEVVAGSQDESVSVRALGSDGLPLEDKVATDFTLWYRRGPTGAKQVLSLSDLSSEEDAHTAGGLIHVGGGWHRVDFPDAAWVAGVSLVEVGGDVAGGVVISAPITLTLSAVGAGEDQCTLTFTVDGSPVADADVWVSSDSAGQRVVAGPLQTNSLGQCEFLLTDGLTYYAWLQKDGVNPINGEEFVAEAD